MTLFVVLEVDSAGHPKFRHESTPEIYTSEECAQADARSLAAFADVQVFALVPHGAVYDSSSTAPVDGL